MKRPHGRASAWSFTFVLAAMLLVATFGIVLLRPTEATTDNPPPRATSFDVRHTWTSEHGDRIEFIAQHIPVNVTILHNMRPVVSLHVPGNAQPAYWNVTPSTRGLFEITSQPQQPTPPPARLAYVWVGNATIAIGPTLDELTTSVRGVRP